MIFRWFYISTSRLAEDESDELVADIVRDSIPRNRKLQVTGALLFTGRHFAQYLEGPATSVGTLQRIILDDLRHEDIRTIAEGAYPCRRFVTWSLAYVPPARSGERRIEQLLSDAAHAREDCVEALAQFMSESPMMGHA
jgi:hypothetical protein